GGLVVPRQGHAGGHVGDVELDLLGEQLAGLARPRDEARALRLDGHADRRRLVGVAAAAALLLRLAGVLPLGGGLVLGHVLQLLRGRPLVRDDARLVDRPGHRVVHGGVQQKGGYEHGQHRQEGGQALRGGPHPQRQLLQETTLVENIQPGVAQRPLGERGHIEGGLAAGRGGGGGGVGGGGVGAGGGGGG